MPPLVHFFFGGGGGGEELGAYSRLGAYYLFLPTGWALIQGWALNRINTVIKFRNITWPGLLMIG